jgi:hypothetical protein
LLILPAWIGGAVAVIMAGLIITRRREPDRYLVMRVVELEPM